MNDSKTTEAISRSAVLAALHELHKQEIDEHPTVYTGIASGISQAFCVVRDAPALDVALVVHGDFERQPEEVFPCIRANPVLCKTCNTTFITLNKEGKRHMCCPYCGARMDGEAE